MPSSSLPFPFSPSLATIPSLPPFPAYNNLRPQEQKLCLRVRHFLTQELHVDVRGQTLLLAVSGGADSLALLSLILLLRPVLGHAVAMAHVNHGLRPESVNEAQYVQHLATAWDVPCHCLTADVRAHAARTGLGIEEAARQIRYTFLEETRMRLDTPWICTGHHAADLREDMLMRLMRGTGWPALGGMTALDNERHLLRPLLMEEPEALKDLLRILKLTWLEDSSNADPTYTRNRVRHQVMPALLEENPAFGDASRQLWRMAQDDKDYWEQRLNTVCAAHRDTWNETEVSLPAALLRELHKAERMHLYMRAVRHLVRGGGSGQSRAITLYQLDDALTQGRGGTEFQLPGGLSAQLKRGTITFRRS